MKVVHTATNRRDDQRDIERVNLTLTIGGEVAHLTKISVTRKNGRGQPHDIRININEQNYMYIYWVATCNNPISYVEVL